jgi:hypothetical protein
MTELAALVVLVVLTAAVAAAAARHFRPDLPLSLPMGAASREEFWRRSMPWPHGVQEETDLSWHVPRPVPPEPPGPSATSRSRAQPVPPTRPQPRLVGR